MHQKSAYLLLFSLDTLGCYEPLYSAGGTDAQRRQSLPPRGSTHSCAANLLQRPLHPNTPNLGKAVSESHALRNHRANQDAGPE